MLKQSKAAEAEPLIRECLAIYSNAMPKSSQYFNYSRALGGALLAQGQYAEAEPLVIAGYEGLKALEPKMPPVIKVDITEAGKQVVQFYQAWGKPEKAEESRRKLGVGGSPAAPPRR
jgi:hypothetical protein